MTTNHLKMGVEPAPKILCLSSIPQKMDNVQYNIHIVEILLKVITRDLLNQLQSLSYASRPTF